MVRNQKGQVNVYGINKLFQWLTRARELGKQEVIVGRHAEIRNEKSVEWPLNGYGIDLLHEYGNHPEG